METEIIQKPMNEEPGLGETKSTDISEKSEEMPTESKKLVSGDTKTTEKPISFKTSEMQKTSSSDKKSGDKMNKIKDTKINKEETKVHKAKAETVKKLAEKIKNSKTLMIVSIKNLPSRQFQSIKKSLRGKALVKVAKKNIMLRAIKKFGKESILPLEKQIQENCAFVISDIEGFELAGILSKEKTPASAKAGQIAPEDIEVKAGPTSLVPGPAISELGALGIQISIDEGKISIKAPKIIIKKEQVINDGAASILQKLDIHPFSVGLEPLVIYDIEKEKIYSNIKIDSEESIENLKNAAGKALGFAQKIMYYCKDTIGYLLAKANAQANKLEGLSPQSSDKEEKVEEPKVEDKTEEKTTENKPISDNALNGEKSLSNESQDIKETKESKDKENTDNQFEKPITDTGEKEEIKEETKNEQ